jgi:hypothetical protein
MDYRLINNESDTDNEGSHETASPPSTVDPRPLNDLSDQLMTNILATALSSKVLPSEFAARLLDQEESSISGQSDRVRPWQYFQIVENKGAGW